MELYRVEVEYRDVPAAREWESRETAHPRRAVEPPPDRKRVTYHVAVHGGWAGRPVARACDLAVKTVIGLPESWDEWQPVVLSCCLIGSVAVQKVEP